MSGKNVIWFENLRMTDVEQVGGKNASLGEMISQLAEKGVRVPGGFATTAEAYRAFLSHNGLNERISAALAELDRISRLVATVETAVARRRDVVANAAAATSTATAVRV